MRQIGCEGARCPEEAAPTAFRQRRTAAAYTQATKPAGTTFWLSPQPILLYFGGLSLGRRLNNQLPLKKATER